MFAEVAIGNRFNDNELKAIYKGLDEGISFGKLTNMSESSKQAFQQCVVTIVLKIQ